MSRVKGWESHRAAVERLVDSYGRIPPGRPVRLAKKTSNLFRPRAATEHPGLDVSELDGVIAVDAEAGTAEVQGMCTYERLVDETLRFGLIPLVVPQLRTITLGGAVTGLGIESTSFRNGLPHESVLEMDVITGDGQVVTTTPDGEHADLFSAFPNSYGSLGYATRLRIELERVPPFVALRHVAFPDAAAAVEAMQRVCDTGEYLDERVDAMDGTAFAPDEIFLTLARFTDEGGEPSDYTGQQIYYRSIRERGHDTLTMHDYLWRWDTDWFWCSAAFGAQHRFVRRVWPRRWRRSDVYHRLVGLDEKLGIVRVLDRIKQVPGRERVVQDIEVPADRLPEFLDWFDREVGMRPVWLCPLRTQRPWSTYPLRPGELYVNAGFWGTVEVPAGSPDGWLNRRIEERVHDLDGHKSLYSESFYDADTFASIYRTGELDRLRKRYDPGARLSSLYEKAVRNS